MMQRVVVFVLDPGNPSRGEISVVDCPEEAQSLMEKLLDAGYSTERFRVFSGNEIVPVVTYQPVVSLVGHESESDSDVANNVPINR